MIALQRIRTTDVPARRFLEKLLTSAFPEEEYRPLDQFARLLDREPRFGAELAADDGVPVGFVTGWTLDRFHFIEHLAVHPDRRCGGCGGQILAALQARLRCPIVLEVERPECADREIAARRIGFYERLGFRLWPNDYRQPPYRPGGREIPMRLMVWGDLAPDRDYDAVADAIHRTVYRSGTSA